MITCFFEDNHKTYLRHVTANGIIIKEYKILLALRSHDSLEGGKWCLPGGFMDRDETLADCVLREIKEETGYEGKIIMPFRINSDPNRPKEDRQNVDFIYLVEAGEKVGEPDHETAEIKWFDLDNLPPEEEFAFDHFDNIQLFLKYQKQNFPLPIIN